MGNFISRVLAKFSGSKECRVVMVGLDAAGKTTILYKLKLGEVVNTVPTIGFNVETVEYKKLQMQVWDVGGQDKIRPLWRHYYEGSDAIVFVVDSNDRERIGGDHSAAVVQHARVPGGPPVECNTAADELAKMLEDPSLRDAALLVYANKQDLPEALGVHEVASALGLTQMRKREWHVQPANGRTGEGLYEGLDWLGEVLARRSKGRAF